MAYLHQLSSGNSAEEEEERVYDPEKMEYKWRTWPFKSTEGSSYTLKKKEVASTEP